MGAIPTSIGNCKYLEVVALDFLSLSSLSVLDLSQNSLFGPLPLEVGNLINLRQFDVSWSNLSGEIPSTIGNCLSLELLYLQGNFFQGSIPRSFGTLKVIQELDLSLNKLSGEIPSYLETFPYLSELNLSFNNLQRKIPIRGVFRNASAFSVLGNSRLCGGILELHFPPCPIPATKRRRRSVSLPVCALLDQSPPWGGHG